MQLLVILYFILMTAPPSAPAFSKGTLFDLRNIYIILGLNIKLGWPMPMLDVIENDTHPCMDMALRGGLDWHVVGGSKIRCPACNLDLMVKFSKAHVGRHSLYYYLWSLLTQVGLILNQQSIFQLCGSQGAVQVEKLWRGFTAQYLQDDNHSSNILF